jgi:threonine dehydrogenase-like Zn-dependent dehydrogenase
VLADEAVAGVNCALSQVIYGLHVASGRLGDSVVIQGAGGLGVQAAAVAKDMGAATGIVVDQIPGRLEQAKASGADHALNFKDVPDRKERVKLVRQWTGGVGADVACDFVGFPAGILEGIEMLRSGGTYLEIGTISRGATIELEPSLLVWGSKKFVRVIQYDPWVIPRARFPRAHQDALAVGPDPLAQVPAREDQRGLRRLGVAQQGDDERHARGSDTVAPCI